MPYFMCDGCFAGLASSKSALKHLNEFCIFEEILCVPCGKNVNKADLEQHQNCNQVEMVDPESLKPAPLLTRLLIVLKEAKATPELTKEAEEVLTEAASKVNKIKIKTVIESKRLLGSPKLKDLVLTVYARELRRFPKKKIVEKSRWNKLVLDILGRTEMSKENKTSLKKTLGSKKLPEGKGANFEEFCGTNCSNSETRELALRIFAKAVAEKDTSTIINKSVDEWRSHLLLAADTIVMSEEHRKVIRQTFAGQPCSSKSGRTTKYVDSHFADPKLRALASLVITRARTNFANKAKTGQTVGKKEKKPKAKVSLVASKLKKKGKPGSGPVVGKQNKGKKPEKADPQTKLPAAEKQKKAKPAQQPAKKQVKQEVESSNQNGGHPSRLERVQNKRKRKAEASSSAVEEAKGAKNKQATKKMKIEPVAKTMEKDNRQKGNVFPKPIAGKKNNKRGKQKMASAINARETKKTKTKSK